MNGTADDPTTLPTGRAHKPVSRAPAPIESPRWYAPPSPVPAAAYVPIAPRGFVAFSNAPERLAANAETWVIPLDRIPAKDDLAAYGRAIETYLAETNERAAGILTSGGNVIWAPNATWRTAAWINRQQVSAAVAAMHGEIIGFPQARTGARLSCYPILSCRTLALVFGAENPPEQPPQFVLDDIRDIEQPTARMTEYPDQSTSPLKVNSAVVATDIGANAPSAAAAPLLTKEDEKRKRWCQWEKAAGGRLPALVEWARKAYGDAPLGRDDMLAHHRGEFGAIRGISDMRDVRAAIASDGAKIGGRPTHRNGRSE